MRSGGKPSRAKFQTFDEEGFFSTTADTPKGQDVGLFCDTDTSSEDPDRLSPSSRSAESLASTPDLLTLFEQPSYDRRLDRDD